MTETTQHKGAEKSGTICGAKSEVFIRHKKYGNTDGKYQETGGPSVARCILNSLGVEHEQISK